MTTPHIDKSTVELEHIAAASVPTPSANQLVLFPNSSNSDHMSIKDSAGTVTDLQAGSGAPTDATYITQTPDSTLSNEQALSLLSTGIMKSTTGTGVVSIAVAGTDYTSPAGTENLTNKTIDMNNTAVRLPSNTSALTTTEAYAAWESARKLVRIYDSQRERAVSLNGWLPYALPPGLVSNNAFSTSFNMNVQWYTVLVPIVVDGHMLLQSVSVWNIDTTGSRTWGWDLYEQALNNGNSGEKTLARIANSTADETFTAAAASARTINAASVPIYLAPGVYWLAIQNRHASNAFQLGAYTATFTPNVLRFKTTAGSNGSTIDASTSWTGTSSMVGVRLNGRVFGETSGF